MPCRATRGSSRVGQNAEGTKEKHGQKPLLWFPWEGMGESGQTDLELANFNNFSGLWGVGPSSSFCYLTL